MRFRLRRHLSSTDPPTAQPNRLRGQNVPYNLAGLLRLAIFWMAFRSEGLSVSRVAIHENHAELCQASDSGQINTFENVVPCPSAHDDDHNGHEECREWDSYLKPHDTCERSK